jgi:hypothetical protein
MVATISVSRMVIISLWRELPFAQSASPQTLAEHGVQGSVNGYFCP